MKAVIRGNYIPACFCVEGELQFCRVVKTLFLRGALALAPAGFVAPTVAHCQANLVKAPLKWPSIQVSSDEGSFDARVAAVQYLLRARGLYKGKIDGLYGSKTIAAVKAFQHKNGLKADGVAGSKTLPRLVMTVKRGSKGDAVRAAQILARQAGDDMGGTPNGGLVVDGTYGAETQKAVKVAQGWENDMETHLVEDGVMGPRSWCLMLGGTVVGSHL